MDRKSSFEMTVITPFEKTAKPPMSLGIIPSQNHTLMITLLFRPTKPAQIFMTF